MAAQGSIAQSAFKRLTEALDRSARCLPDIERSAALIQESLANGHTIFACGNGGSAASAQHFTAELTGRYVKERGPFAALSLHTDSSLVTAIANDYGYEEVFARQLHALGKKGDTLVALTTGGKSANILKALEAAHAKDMETVVLTGEKGAHLKSSPSVSVCIVVASDETPRVQEIHDLVIHVWCECIDAGK